MNSSTHCEKCFLVKSIGKYVYILTTFRLLKNRKSARKSRRRRKAELTSLRDEIKLLKEENQKLKSLLK